MSDGVKLITYLFVLALVLIVVAYYAGVQTDASAFSNAINSLIQTSTGRNSANQFANYPQGYVSAG